MSKKIRQAFRFSDVELAKEFIEENKLPYDEVIILFDNFVEEEEAEEEAKTEVKNLPEQEVDKDAIIKELARENEELKQGGGELPNPKKPSFNPFKKKAPKVVTIKETRE